MERDKDLGERAQGPDRKAQIVKSVGLTPLLCANSQKCRPDPSVVWRLLHHCHVVHVDGISYRL